MIESLLIIAIVTFAVFVQTASGFGIAMVAMPLLASVTSMAIAAPLVALVAMITRCSMLLHYRASISWPDVRGLVVGSVLGIAAGTILLSFICVDISANAALVEAGLGAFIVGYALFGLLNLRLPELRASHWAYTLGFLGGMLARVYNTGGAPAVIYAQERQWPPDAFKENLQAYAVVNGVLVIAARALQGEFTAGVLGIFLLTLPAITIGLATGYLLDRYVSGEAFRKIVLLLLLFVGIGLLI